MTNKKNYEIRKVAWDRLWHVVYKINNRETWDRITAKEAMRIVGEGQ